jgi:hypothetical protein
MLYQQNSILFLSMLLPKFKRSSTAAAIRLYMKEAFSDNFSLIITFGYLLTIVAVIAADSYVVGPALT